VLTTRTDGPFDYASLAHVAHRPWPKPSRPWVMTQTWTDLLFAHWPTSSDQLAPHIPDGLDLDLFAGTAWVGVVPFRMSNVSARGLPNLPGLSAFPELNVRTYVTRAGKPGVFFFSLDAYNRAAVHTARMLFNLPYHFARMDVARRRRMIHYSSTRHSGEAEFEAVYWPVGETFTAAPGSLDAFLTERYCLYTPSRSGQIRRLDIHHRPWALQPASARIMKNSMTQHLFADMPPLVLHFSERQDVVAWLPERA
jgi:uncharacterized protein YqjF (DUF2071 family)